MESVLRFRVGFVRQVDGRMDNGQWPPLRQAWFISCPVLRPRPAYVYCLSVITELVLAMESRTALAGLRCRCADPNSQPLLARVSCRPDVHCELPTLPAKAPTTREIAVSPCTAAISNCPQCK